MRGTIWVFAVVAMGCARPSSSETAGEEVDTGEEAPEPKLDMPALPEGAECATDADCILHDACCSCFPKTLDQCYTCSTEPAWRFLDLGSEECAGCGQTMCDEMGVPGVRCAVGQCDFRRVNCDASEVICDEEPPDCESGFPRVSDGCWTGSCASASLCNAVPDCDACGAGTVCVEAGPHGTLSCEPLPSPCAGSPTCACLEPYGLCGGSTCTDRDGRPRCG